MKYLIFPLLVLPALLMSLLPSTDPAPATSLVATAASEMEQAEGSPVVLELFTSQGCSSCPSADALLQELEANNDQVVALSFHVDYWNYLGWEDPFSSPYYSARQTDYTEVLQARTYTPQLIVNGRQAMIGSRRSEVEQAVKNALKEPLAFSPQLKVARAATYITVSYAFTEMPGNARVTALLVQPETTSAVKRGENRGRELHHVNVVRAMKHQAAAPSGELKVDLPPGQEADQLQVVVLVQDTHSQAIVGVAREK